MIAQHLSKTNEHYTPPDVVEAARIALGGAIDLDPASCAAANEMVRAESYMDQDDDGLNLPWYGRVFLNPPGGILRKLDGRWIVPEKKNPSLDRSSMAVWWEELSRRFVYREIESAIFVGFTLEILRTSQDGPYPIQKFDRCYPKSRLKFGGNSPTHANVIAYLGPDYDRFRSAFRSIGLCEPGVL